MDARAVYKVLGDDTRFAIYRELTAASGPLSASEVADRLGLHPNTVRPHLDRMREVGLVEVETIHRGTVGRPQHRYSLAAGAPGSGVEPPAHTLLAGLLAALAEQSGLGAEDATDAGRTWGLEAAGRTRARTCLRALTGELDRLGFEPDEEALDGGRVRVSFLHCPFRELAEAYPELVCNLHRGIVEGVVSGTRGGMVEDFNTLYDRDPCNATVVMGAGYADEQP